VFFSTSSTLTHFFVQIHVHDAHTGFRAGQHVRLRVFAGGLVFQSHPLTILAAPSHTSVLPASVIPPGSLALGARSAGDWSRAVNALARSTSTPDAACEATPLIAGDGTPVTVMLDGPYGGLAIDLGTHEHVLLLAGGSGLTFALGVLDDLVGRIARHGRAGGEVTRRVELAWCIRSFGAIYWFAPHLQALARTVEQTPGLTLHIAVYVTCLCDPEAVPDIPNSVVTVERPDARRMLGTFLAGTDLGPGCSAGSLESAEAVEVGPTKGSPEMSEKDVPVLEHGAGAGVAGGVALCVAGPESLCREAANAVAIMGAREGVRVGGISFHSEVYAL
jgi:ferric-chelate reductase